MNLRGALWTEFLKTRRSGTPWLVSLGFCMVPVMGGFFMLILKDPEAARSMGLISEKASLTVGEASWPAFFNMMGQGSAMGGMILFGILTAWIFGREYSDHTIKELLAVPTSRSAIVLAKFLVAAGWGAVTALLVFGIGLFVGSRVHIPGWSTGLLLASFVDFMGASLLSIMLVPYIAFAASRGRGYLPAFGWLILTTVLAQVSAITGWGEYFPWVMPALFSGMAGPRSEQLGMHSYIILVFSSLVGVVITLAWWQEADQTQ